MALTSFCGLLTLQVGAAMLAAVFFAISGAILAANIFDYHSEGTWFPTSLVLMLIFVVGLLIVATLIFSSSYSESRSLAIMAVVVIVILICYWLILCALSFLSNPDHVRGVCIDTRCPETFWLGNLGFRRQLIEDPEEEFPAETENFDAPIIGSVIEKFDAVRKNWTKKVVGFVSNERGQKPVDGHKAELKRDQEHFEIKEHIVNFVSNQNRTNVSEIESLDDHQRRVYPFAIKQERMWQDGMVLKYAVGNIKRDLIQRQHERENTTVICPQEESSPSRYVFGFPMIGAIILFFTNLIFLLFSAYVMYSWGQELYWADYYYYDDSPVILLD